VNESSLINASITESTFKSSTTTVDTMTIVDRIQNIDTATGVYIYSFLIVTFFFFTLIRTIQFFSICMSASIKLHNRMFKSIIRSKVVFFDQNPVGKNGSYMNLVVLTTSRDIFSIPNRLFFPELSMAT